MNYRYGLKKGIPIALGYLSVSFGFGITAVNQGLGWIEALLISMTNMTSAGQLAGVSVIASLGTIAEIILTQIVINMRYCLMGLSLTQKLDKNFNTFHRIFVAFGITDEVFAVASSELSNVTPRYMYGLITLPYIGWSLGTFLGAYSGNILPQSVSSALGIAIYGMFIAIIIPPAKKSKGVLFTIIISTVLSLAFYYIPVFSGLSQGFSIIICAVVASTVMAYLKPVED